MASPKAIILVTGANSGVGYEVSKLLATTSSSYHVLICGRTLAKAEQAVFSIQALSPKGTLEPLELDISLIYPTSQMLSRTSKKNTST